MLSFNNHQAPVEPHEEKYGKVRIPVNAGNQQQATPGKTAAETGREPGSEAAEEGEPDWKEKYLRLYADLENTKRRLARNYEIKTEQEKEKLLRDMLPLADNLERALAHAAAETGRQDGAQRDSPLYQGIELTLKAFRDVMARYGVQPVEAQGEPFDPELHEAVGLLSNPDLPPGTVASVELKGYTFRDRLLRPARVLVTAD